MYHVFCYGNQILLNKKCLSLRLLLISVTNHTLIIAKKCDASVKIRHDQLFHESASELLYTLMNRFSSLLSSVNICAKERYDRKHFRFASPQATNSLGQHGKSRCGQRRGGKSESRTQRCAVSSRFCIRRYNGFGARAGPRHGAALLDYD